MAGGAEGCYATGRRSAKSKRMNLRHVTALALVIACSFFAVPRSVLAVEVSERAVRAVCLFALDPSTQLINNDDERTAMLIRSVEDSTRLSGGKAYLVGKQALSLVSRDPNQCKPFASSAPDSRQGLKAKPFQIPDVSPQEVRGAMEVMCRVYHDPKAFEPTYDNDKVVASTVDAIEAADHIPGWRAYLLWSALLDQYKAIGSFPACSGLPPGGVGRHLMVPPVGRTADGDLVIGINRPLQNWITSRTYDSAEECRHDQGLLRRNLGLVNEPFDYPAAVSGDDATEIIKLLNKHSQCIATDDPRLKEK